MIINLIRLITFKVVLCSFLFGTSGCGTAVEQREPIKIIKMSPLCHYKLDEDLLQEGDSLRLLYASWDTNDERISNEHYIQVVALKLASGDTVNILTGFDTKFTQEDGDRIFVYQKYDRDFQQIIAQQEADFLANKNKMLNPEAAQQFADKLAENVGDIYKYNQGPAVYIDGTMEEAFENSFSFTIGKLIRL